MSRLVQQHGPTRVIRLGARADMPAVYSALDILVSSSSTEAFSLTIAEAMSCGLPCVVTNVGDSAAIVGATGRVVPANAPAALAGAIRRVADLSGDARAEIGAQARQRIVENFAIAGVARRYADILRRASAARARGHSVAADAARTEAR
jgi:glycosyltransferase involved in cell wall biosynthesis